MQERGCPAPVGRSSWERPERSSASISRLCRYGAFPELTALVPQITDLLLLAADVCSLRRLFIVGWSVSVSVPALLRAGRAAVRHPGEILSAFPRRRSPAKTIAAGGPLIGFFSGRSAGQRCRRSLVRFSPSQWRAQHNSAWCDADRRRRVGGPRRAVRQSVWRETGQGFGQRPPPSPRRVRCRLFALPSSHRASWRGRCPGGGGIFPGA